MYPIWRRIASPSRATSRPSTLARPSVGASSPHRMRISVDLPEPLGPSSPYTMPVGTRSETLRSANMSPNARETFSTTIASVTRHRDRRGHPGAQLVGAGGDADPGREHLVGALVGGLQIARRVLADAVDVLDHALEALVGERVDRDRHLLADRDVAELGLGHVDPDVELIVLDQGRRGRVRRDDRAGPQVERLDP